MHLAFDICTGIGVAAAVGIRPFLPALLVAVLAAGSVQIHFNHTHFSFLQSVPFLLALVLLAMLLAFFERRLAREGRFDPKLVATTIAVISLVLGALLFAGSLARGHYDAWPGYLAGAVCAAIAILATRPLFERVRARLDPEAARAVPLYAEAAGVILAGLSVIAPPIGLIGLIFLLWLLIAGQRREGQKYAGLRILR